jgi:two-component system OmpR family sensor kinase
LLRLTQGIAGPNTSSIAEIYVGVIENGQLTTVQAPTDDPDLVPSVPADNPPTTPITRPTLSGEAPQVRIVTIDLPQRRTAVFAVSTARADDAVQRLMATLAVAAAVVLLLVGLVAWWVIRLGLQPIRRMTAAADPSAPAPRRHHRDHPRQHRGRPPQPLLSTMIDTTRRPRPRPAASPTPHERTPLTTPRLPRCTPANCPRTRGPPR